MKDHLKMSGCQKNVNIVLDLIDTCVQVGTFQTTH